METKRERNKKKERKERKKERKKIYTRSQCKTRKAHK